MIGFEAHASQDLAAVSLEIIRANADTLRAMNLMGPEADVPTDADAMTRLLGLIDRGDEDPDPAHRCHQNIDPTIISPPVAR